VVTKRLRELGYRVGVNMMRTAAAPSEQISVLASSVESWGTTDAGFFFHFSALRSLATRNSTSFSYSEVERSLHSFRDDRPLDAGAQARIIPAPLVFAYALALCIAGRARQVFVVGLDGFAANDSRQAEMLELLRVVESSRGDMNITAPTPTNYPVRRGSVYAD
jgi:hypothetical protein